MINKNSKEPKYIQIERYLLSLIEDEVYKEGDLFPSETILREELQVSRMTIRQAINSLVLNGYLKRRRGLGTFVLSRDSEKIELSLDKLRNFSKEAKSIGCEFSTKVVSFSVEKAPKKIAKHLGVSIGEKLFFIERVRYLEGEPAVFESTYMLYEPFKDLTKEILEKSKFTYIQEKGFSIKESKREILAEIPIGKVGELLNLKRDEPLLKARSIAFLKDGTPFEYSEISYNQKKYKFSLISNYQ